MLSFYKQQTVFIQIVSKKIILIENPKNNNMYYFGY